MKSDWANVVELWRNTLNRALPADCHITKDEARRLADRLLIILRKEVKREGRLPVPELGVFHRVDLKPRTMPNGAKAKATSHLGFRAGMSARWKASRKP